MKVFFSNSISRSRMLLPVSQDIVRHIEEMGHEVLTKELVDQNRTSEPGWDTKLDPKKVYSSAEKRLQEADILITECTIGSFGAAWWIDKAVIMKKPLLSLHYGELETDAPLMLRARAKEINLQMYTDNTIKHVLQQFFGSLQAI